MTIPSIFKIVIGASACVAVAVALAYLSGLLYFAVNRVWPDTLAWDTWLRYWHGYGSDPVQRPRLLASAAMAAMVIFVALLGLLAQVWQRPRPLHGAARWATEAEIRAAGLL